MTATTTITWDSETWQQYCVVVEVEGKTYKAMGRDAEELRDRVGVINDYWHKVREGLTVIGQENNKAGKIVREISEAFENIYWNLAYIDSSELDAMAGK